MGELVAKCVFNSKKKKHIYGRKYFKMVHDIWTFVY